MAVTLTIGGVSKNYVGGSLRINYAANYHSTATFSIRSNDGSYRPAYDDDVVISVDGTPVLGGLIDQPGEHGTLGDQTGASNAILTDINVVDYSAYTARRYVTETLAAGTLKSMLTTLVTNYLAVYGVSLSGSQADGPTLPSVVYTDKLLADVINELSTLTAKYGEQYVFSIDPSKVALMAAPSTQAAPFDIPGADAIGDIQVKVDGTKQANRVIVTVPSKSEDGRVERFTGDGSTTTFTLNYTLKKSYGIINLYELDGVTPAGGETFGIPPSSPIQWSYDSSTNTITREVGPTDATKIYALMFDGVYTGRGDATDASWSTNPRERVVPLTSAPSDTTVQAYAEGLLARYLEAGKTITYKTFGSGLLPGQSQHITYAARDLDDDTIITAVTAQDYGDRGRRLLYSVTAVTGTSIPDQFQDTYKLWSGLSTAETTTAAAVGTGGAASIGAAPPVKAVQYNSSGSFGGDEDFEFYADENSLHCGNSSSITAADFESCQVFGYDCHIADPS